MKKYLLILFVLFCYSASCQEFRWDWVKTFGTKGADEIRCISRDNFNNIIIGGYFSGKIPIGNNVLFAKGEQDILIIKLSENGEIIWAEQAGSKFNEKDYICEYASEIVSDSKGNIFVAGTFQSTAEFQDSSLVSNGNVDIFIAKYFPDGKLVWVKNIGNYDNDWLFDLKIDKLNNLYLSGYHHDLINNKVYTIYYLYKLSTGGQTIWKDERIGDLDNSFLKIGNSTITNCVTFKDKLDNNYSKIHSYTIDASNVLNIVKESEIIFNDSIKIERRIDNDYVHMTNFYENIDDSNKSLFVTGNWINTAISISNFQSEMDYYINGIVYDYHFQDSTLLLVGSYNLDNDYNFNYEHYGYVDGFLGKINIGLLTKKNKNTDTDLELKVFPNPTKDYCQIELIGSFQLNSIKLMSLNGSVLKEFKTLKFPYLINLSDLPKGKYLLILEDDRTYISEIIVLI